METVCESLLSCSFDSHGISTKCLWKTSCSSSKVAFESDDIPFKGLWNASVARVLHRLQFTPHRRNDSSHSYMRDAITFGDQILGNLTWLSRPQVNIGEISAPHLNLLVCTCVETFYLQWLLSGGVSVACEFYSRPWQPHFDGCDIYSTHVCRRRCRAPGWINPFPH